jgi:hypothetical protein
MVRADGFPGLLGGFLRSGFAAFGIFCAGCAAPPTAASAARPVRAISSILHQTGNCKPALAAALRSAARATRHSIRISVSHWEKGIFGLRDLITN